ncbi:MAG: sugar transferase [Bacteroidales bacterium]
MKRFFDIVFSLLGLVFLCWLFVILALCVGLTSKGGVFYKQKRVGRNGKDFVLYKFRSMHIDADKDSLITIGRRDIRITKIGYFIRKHKLDELPQLINVLLGDMSLVGPRPEVRFYVNMYTEEQKKVLDVRPGITDPSSIIYKNENDVLGTQNNPQQYYVDVIMPNKLQINLEYIQKRTLFTDIKVILQTMRIL